MEVIRSRQNPLIRQLIKLASQRRERLKTGQALLIGTHLVDAALRANFPLQKLLVCEGAETAPEIAALLQRSTAPTLVIDRTLFTEIEQSPSSTGLMALIAIPTAEPPQTSGFCLLLEDIQDPGNVGSILRSAAGAGVDQVWLSAGCADAWSPKVLRAGMGAHFLIPVLERVSPLSALPAFQGQIAITCLTDSQNLYNSDLCQPMVLVMGNEGSGVSQALSAIATQRLHIPMANQLESLNVAAATAICLFERARQQASQGKGAP